MHEVDKCHCGYQDQTPESSVLEMWFPCCYSCSPCFSHIDLKCGSCGETTQLDLTAIQTEDGKNAYEWTDGFDYYLLPGRCLVTVCEHCEKESKFTMYENEEETGNISFIRLKN